MGTIRVSACSISLDGYGAAPGQSLEHPFGRGGMAVTTWMKETRFFHEMTGQPGGAEGVDHALCLASMEGVGAWIMGRNMFTPARGAWDLEWKGWWGPNPPTTCPCSCSRTTRDLHSQWKAATCSTSSPEASMKH